MKTKKSELFDPATARDLHVVVLTTSLNQTIHAFGNEEAARRSLQPQLEMQGMYQYPFKLERLHVLTTSSTYTTWHRESYTRECTDGPVIAQLTNFEVECPLTFRDERDSKGDKS
jgi:hypothetical protein